MRKSSHEEPKKISSMREKIDRVDDKIIELLKERFDLVHEIGNLKKSKGIDVFDNSREMEVIKRCKEKSKGIDKVFIENFFRLVMDESKRIQKEKK